MLIETGRVFAVDRDCLWVESIRRSTCNSCSARKGCGHSLIVKTSTDKSHRFRVLLQGRDPSAFEVGQFVQVSLPESLLLRAAGLVYLLPLAGLIGGAALASWLFVGSGDPVAIAGAIAGMFVSFVAVNMHSRRNRHNPSMHPKIVDLQSHKNCDSSIQTLEIIEP